MAMVWDDREAILSSLARGCRIVNDKMKIRLPIQKGLFEMLLYELERYFGGNHPQPYLEIMYKALFCLAYYGMLRVGELTLGDHTLKAGDVHVSGSSERILIVLYTSKTHGEESSPQEIKISATPMAPADVRNFCPVRAVIRYMQTRGPFMDEEIEEFFVFADRSPVRPEHFRTLLRNLLTHLNLDGTL